MRKILYFALVWMLSVTAVAQNDVSFLCVDGFKQQSVQFVLPDELLDRPKDDNNRPWAMIEVVANGFDGRTLKEMKVYSESSKLCLGSVVYVDNEECLRIYLSSGVGDGRLVFKYSQTTLEYPLQKLAGQKVYKLTLSMRSANLTIVATPAESKIFIDGQEVGSEGYASVDLRMGEHTYSVECDDYLGEKNKTIMLSKNETVHVALQPLFGYVTVTSRPSGADVIINGERVGVTPYLNKRIQRGRNNIELQLNGYHEYAEFLEVTNGERKNVDVQLVSYDNVATGNSIPSELTLRLSDDTLRFNAAVSRDSIFVSTNSVEWDFMEPPRWISLYKRNNILYVTCHENLVHQSREADLVVFTGDIQKTLHVYQDVGKTVLKSKGNKVIFGAGRDSTTRQVETNVVDWNITTSEPWIKAYELGDTLVIVCEENTLPVSRQGSVDVRAFDQEIKFDVSQKSRVTNIDVPSTDIAVGHDGGVTTIPTGLTDGAWTCRTDDKWMKVACSGSDVSLECQANKDERRHGSFVIDTDTKKYKINVVQSGPNEIDNVVVIDSKPSWSRVSIDGKKKVRTPLHMAIDDSLHTVSLGRENRSYMFNDQLRTISFNTGLRYIQATVTSGAVGLRSGFIGSKHWGGYTHFQMNVDNWDINKDSKNQPLYMVSFGPSYEILPWMSAYAGLGLAMTNDSISTQKQDIHVGIELETGLMFYYRNIFASLGIQTTPTLEGHKDVGFSAGLGMYFNRYYDKKKGYCSTQSRNWWSLSYMYNAARKGHGVMFGDIGKGSVRGYIKVMLEQPEKLSKTDYTDENGNIIGSSYEAVYRNYKVPGLSLGVVFDAIPGSIDLLAGAGYMSGFDGSKLMEHNFELDWGLVMNIWRFPLTVLMRYGDIGKDSAFLTVDFGIGFSFGEFSK